MLMFCGSWSVLDSEEETEPTVERVGVGDETRDGGSDGDLGRGDEEVDEIVWDRLTAELFDG